MADPRFYAKSGSHSLSELAKLTGAEVQRAADVARCYDGLAALDAATANDIGFIDNVKYLDAFEKSRAGACFVHPKHVERAPEAMALLVTQTPYAAYAKAANLFYPQEASTQAISPHAVIDETASLGKGVQIDAGAVIEAGVEIDDEVVIGANAVISQGVTIGKKSRIGACSTISHAIIGESCIIHRGVHIGTDGFGFAPTNSGILKVPQLGRVIIGNHVEIGSNSCIDRGAGPDTVIGNGVKIDNLVQIGHNVKIGDFAIIVSQVGIAGSSEIGAAVQVGGQSGIAGHITIGPGARLAARSAAAQSLEGGQDYGGAPAIPAREWKRQLVEIARLGKRKEKR